MNEINVIAPYKYLGMWVFDDPRVGLVQEPFVGGTDSIIDNLVSHILNADKGFAMVFSGKPFPGHQFRFEWLRPEGTGNVYLSQEMNLEGWLCPALLRYFDGPPQELFVEVKPA